MVGDRATTEITRIRRATANRIWRRTPEEARTILRQISARGPVMDQPEIRKLTGGFCSQSLNAWVIRKLAARAGMVPKEAA